MIAFGKPPARRATHPTATLFVISFTLFTGDRLDPRDPRERPEPAPATCRQRPNPGQETTLAEIRAQRDPTPRDDLRHLVRPVYRYCHRRLGTTEAAEDAASAFERVLGASRLPTRRSVRHVLRSWLFAIAHNTIVDQHRRRRFTSRSVAASAWRPATDPPARPARPPTTRRSAATPTAPSAGAGNLPRQRRVVELRLAGLTGPEIATALDTTHSSVKSAQFRAYQTMRATLTALGYAPEDDR